MLERLARGDRWERAAAESSSSSASTKGPDPRSVCLLRLGALVASVSSQATFQHLVTDSIIAGLGSDEIIEAMAALTSVVGRARVAAAAPKLALALGYDLGTIHLDASSLIAD